MVAILDAQPRYKRSLPPKIGGRPLKTEIIPAIYCAGDSAGVSSAAAGDSVVAAGASVAAGLVSVVTGAVVGAGVVTGATVSVFCSQAARSAAPARMQMYFFIIGNAHSFNRSIAASAVFDADLLKHKLLATRTKRAAPTSNRARRLRPGK